MVVTEAPDREQEGGIPAPPIQGGGRGWWPSVHQRDRCTRACKRGSPDREQKGRLCSAGPEKMVPFARDAPRRRHPAMGGLGHVGQSIGCSVTNCVRIGGRGGPPPWTVAFARSWSRGKQGSAPINGCGVRIVTATGATNVAALTAVQVSPRSAVRPSPGKGLLTVGRSGVPIDHHRFGSCGLRRQWDRRDER